MSSAPTADEVAAASAAWEWVPDDATSYAGDGCLLVRYPDHLADPLMVLRTSIVRPGLVDDVLTRAATLEVGHLVWWVKLDAPSGLEELLVSRGGVLDEALDVLARSIADFDAVPPTDVEMRWQVDLPTRRDGYAVDAAVFGGRLPSDDYLRAGVALERAEIGTGLGGRLVAYLDGQPVGTGGISLVDGVARLWGGGVVEAARGRGVYAALLTARLAYARRFGASMALVKARVDTSGPILRRAGFAAYGQERSYRFELR